ncbi:hypothetical protein [Cetobacterium somerae]|nr:hypothetical protein [Cetobacterium somerae]
MNNTYTEKIIMNSFQGNGNLIFLKGLNINTLEIKGKLTVLDDCNFEKFVFSGKAEVGNLLGNTLQLHGSIVGKNISAENIDIFGEFNLESILGKNINIKGGNGHINSIKGDSISILGASEEDKRNAINGIDNIFKESFFKKISEYINFDKLKEHMNSEDSYIYIDKIVGRDIKLKNVIANYVEGTNIEILEGCKIKVLNKNNI